MKKSFLTVCFVVLVFGLMFSLSSCQKKQETETGAQPGVSESTTTPPAETGAPAPEAPAPTAGAPSAPSTEAPAAPAPAAPGSEVPAPPAAGGSAQ
jgi:hypothetical protein